MKKFEKEIGECTEVYEVIAIVYPITITQNIDYTRI
jgi:hypothetical protein